MNQLAKADDVSVAVAHGRIRAMTQVAPVAKIGIALHASTSKVCSTVRS